jgi:hypothetical protein
MFLYLVQARAPSALLCTQNATPVFYNVLCICLSRACLGKPMAFLALNIGSENGAEKGRLSHLVRCGVEELLRRRQRAHLIKQKSNERRRQVPVIKSAHQQKKQPPPSSSAREREPKQTMELRNSKQSNVTNAKHTHLVLRRQAAVPEARSSGSSSSSSSSSSSHARSIHAKDRHVKGFTQRNSRKGITQTGGGGRRGARGGRGGAPLYHHRRVCHVALVVV